MECVICENPIDHLIGDDGKTYWKIGHNARPICAGRCCSVCNERVVIPERLQRILEAEEEHMIMEEYIDG
tara:strand:+ start:333 stop:542 length:210 start_codon:yes stop_codon:yes gene_type:complete